MPCLPFAVPVSSITDYLPAHLLLGIFDHLPLCEVFSLDKICQRFRSLKPSALERRREVVLVVGREWRGFSAEFAYQNRLLQQDGTEWFGPPVDTAHSRLRFETLNGETVKQLCGSLPAVATLQVMLTDVGSSESVDGLIYLLAKWAFTLTTLKVGARFRETRRHSTARTGDAEELIARNLCSLLTVVNQLPELQHLALQLHHRLLPPVNLSGQSGQSASPQPKPVDLSALSRLQSAFLLSHDRAAVFYDALKRHAERNAALVSLGLQSCVDAEQFYRAKLARLSALFAAKFLALDLGRAKLTQRDMDALGAHFSALTHLGLTLSTPVALLPVLLRSCKALTHLQLYIHTASYMQANSGSRRWPLITKTNVYHHHLSH